MSAKRHDGWVENHLGSGDGVQLNPPQTPWAMHEWESYESWCNEQLSPDMTFEEALNAIENLLEFARSVGPLPETPIEEKAARVARLHRALACLSR